MVAILGATTSRLLNRLAYALNNRATALTAVAGDDLVAVSDASADGEVKYVAVADLNAGSGMVETVITTNVITAAESGKTFFLDLAGGFTSTLPAPAAGLKFTFIVKTDPTTAYIITTNAGADVIVIGINELEVDTSSDGPYDINADTVNFVANVAVEGDYMTFISDGTKWYGHGQTNADGGVTTSTT